jgi:hypothetical protein
VIPPDLGAEANRVKPAGPDPRRDKDVGDGITVAEGQYLIAIAIAEQADRQQAPALSAQHDSSVAA